MKPLFSAADKAETDSFATPNGGLRPTLSAERFPAEDADAESETFDTRSAAIASMAGAITALVGATVLTGWLLGILPLTTIVVGGVAMKANAGLGFVLAGTSLWLSVRKAPRHWQLMSARGMALLVALLGATTLFEYIFQRNLHIDEFLATDAGLVYLPAPGRIAPATASCFVLVAIALLLLRTNRSMSRVLVQAATLLTLLVSALTIVGYAYGLSSLDQLPAASSMALHTAATFVVVSLGILYSRRDLAVMAPIRSSSPGGIVARALLPAILIAPLMGWLRLKGEAAGLYGRELGLAISTTIMLAILISVVWWCARSLNQVDAERKRVGRALRESERIYRAIGESIDYGVWLCDPSGKNVYASPSFLKLVGMSQKQCAEFGWRDVLHPDDADRTIEAWKHCVATLGKWDVEHRFRGVDGDWHSVLARGVPVTDERGKLLCWAGINLDISRLKRVELQLKRAFDDQDVRIRERTAELTAVNEKLYQSLAEKEVLLREVHHRVKNNLQVVSSLLHLQSLHTGDQASAEMFQESQHRVRSMALVHERLYRSKDLAQIEFSEYIQGLANSMFQSYNVDSSRIRLETNVHEARLAIDTAVPCGLLINELVSNCLKHAFVGRERGNVRIDLLAMTDNEFLLCVADDGIGLASNFNPRAAVSFGMQVITALVDQLHGQLEVRGDAGTEFHILFPKTVS